MRRKPFSMSLMVSGFVLLAGLTFWNVPKTASMEAQAQTLPPRPTLSPTPSSSGGNSGGDQSAPVVGRITGTVINLTTGAPAPGIAVVVGDVTVTSDANGNYDRSNLPAGSYTVALALTAGQGTPAQGPITINVTTNTPVIQHLSFRSQPAITPTTVIPVPTSVPAPTTRPAPPPPQTMPMTGGSGGAELPLGMVLGIVMIISGALLWRTTRREHM